MEESPSNFRTFKLVSHFRPDDGDPIQWPFDCWAPSKKQAGTVGLLHHLIILDGLGFKVPWDNLRYRR